MSEEIKPCPHCAAKTLCKSWETAADGWLAEASCTECPAGMFFGFGEGTENAIRAKAIKLWNARTGDLELAELREKAAMWDYVHRMELLVTRDGGKNGPVQFTVRAWDNQEFTEHTYEDAVATAMKHDGVEV